VIAYVKTNTTKHFRADELFQSLLHKELDARGKGWEVKRIKDIVSEISYGLSISVQHQIIQKLQSVQDYKRKLLAQKQKLQELFESCLDKAMKGELVK